MGIRCLTAWGLILASALLLASCGGSGGSNNETASAEEPEPVEIQTGAQVCALVDETEVASILGLPSVAASGSSEGTPHCSYASPNAYPSPVVLALLRRNEDLAGRAGGSAFQYSVDINRALFPAVVASEITDVGSNAAFLDSADFKLLIVQVGSRILTVTGQQITPETASAIAASAIASFTQGTTESQ